MSKCNQLVKAMAKDFWNSVKKIPTSLDFQQTSPNQPTLTSSWKNSPNDFLKSVSANKIWQQFLPDLPSAAKSPLCPLMLLFHQEKTGKPSEQQLSITKQTSKLQDITQE